jgi:hypothetical protein
MTSQEPAGIRASGYPVPQRDLNNSIITLSGVQALLSLVPISNVYKEATGVEPKKCGQGRWRTPATWRGGDGWNVVMDDGKGVWHDFVTGEGGGILDLTQRVNGCSRREAVFWLAALGGMHVAEGRQPRHRRSEHARQHAEMQRDLAAARYWRQSALQLCEAVMDELKKRLSDFSISDTDFDELRAISSLARLLQWCEDAVLVAEYRTWRTSHLTLTAALVLAGQRHEERYRAALERFLAAEGGGANGGD